tara:strand:+ start:40 stop:579 length:540 start_codon:yes stop_codon:yes gene_type:complete
MVEWKDIEGWEESYQVSNDGRVRSLTRIMEDTIGRKQTKTGKILSPGLDTKGYHRVSLCGYGRRKTYKVHRLVAQAFIPNPEDKPTVNHRDEKGTKTNNRVENLEWATHKEQWQHAFRTGLWDKKGEKQNTSKLTDKDVLSIRESYDGKYGSFKLLAKRYKVTPLTIKNVVTKVTWNHI